MRSHLESLEGKVALVTEASRGIGRAAAVALLGLLLLPIACRAEPPVGAPVAGNAHAETNADGPIASPEPDWPQWNGPRRNGISRETGLLTTWPDAGPRLVWKIGNGLATVSGTSRVIENRVSLAPYCTPSCAGNGGV